MRIPGRPWGDRYSHLPSDGTGGGFGGRGSGAGAGGVGGSGGNGFFVIGARLENRFYCIGLA
jgi:hypothetical protein